MRHPSPAAANGRPGPPRVGEGGRRPGEGSAPACGLGYHLLYLRHAFPVARHPCSLAQWSEAPRGGSVE